MPGGVGEDVGSAGKGNAILLPKDVTIRQEKQITLNTNPFCEEQAGKLGLDAEAGALVGARAARLPGRPRSSCPTGSRLLVANLHATSLTSDRRLAEAELRARLKFIDRQAETEETVIVAGDFNIELVVSPTMLET